MVEKSMKSVLVECSTSEGMFDSECAVAIKTLDGPVSLFADRTLIQSQDSETMLRSYASPFLSAQKFTSYSQQRLSYSQQSLSKQERDGSESHWQVSADLLVSYTSWQEDR